MQSHGRAPANSHRPGKGAARQRLAAPPRKQRWAPGATCGSTYPLRPFLLSRSLKRLAAMMAVEAGVWEGVGVEELQVAVATKGVRQRA